MNISLGTNENNASTLDALNLEAITERLEDALSLIEGTIEKGYPTVSDGFNRHQMTDKEFLDLIYERLQFSYFDLKEIHCKLKDLTGGNSAM